MTEFFEGAAMERRIEQAIVAAGVAGLPALYQAGNLTPILAVDAYLGRIARHNAALGAFLTVLDAEARREARESAARWAAGAPLSPLDGVPIGVKANIAVKGAPWHAGIRAFAGRIADADAPCVAALRRQGAIVLGLLNMDEGALGGTGDNPWFGRTHNPYRGDVSPGGSSSGSGAAVAAGLCAAALGTDTMGSVRLPAAFCGCVGYKPSRGRIGVEGVVPLAETLDHVGVLARSVADCAIVADGAAAAGPLPRLDLRLKNLRLGVIAGLAGAEIDLAARSGAEIIPLDFSGYDFGRVKRHCLLVIEVEAMAAHPIIRTDPAGFSDGFVQMLRWGAGQPEAKIAEAYRAVASAAEFIRARLSGVSALILPMAPGETFPFGSPPADLGDLAAPANIAGLPSVAIPAGLSRNGLPLSVQCLGLDDATVLAVSEAIARLIGSFPPPAGFGLAG